uniref:Uncharacterized protein n=1 Tax=Solibacter usitatus (strain Ellin6076) TaxID=234267 RepID=Q01WC8_SOLUE
MTRKNANPHVSIVLAGLLATRSLIRNTMSIVYNAKYPSQKERNKAVMGYLVSIGVPKTLTFDDLANLLEVVFDDNTKTKGTGVFPISLDYDQDNCEYTLLIAGAADLDNQEA